MRIYSIIAAIIIGICPLALYAATGTDSASTNVKKQSQVIKKITYSSGGNTRPIQPSGDFTQFEPCPNSPYDIKTQTNRLIELPTICKDFITGQWPVAVVRGVTFANANSITPAPYVDITFAYGGFPRIFPMSDSDLIKKYCPEVCVTTQRVIRDPAVTGPIVGLRGAICPDGYAQVASFNMQPEVIKVTGSNTLSTPVPLTMAEYAEYKRGGWTCPIKSSSSEEVENRICVDVESPQYATYKNRVNVNWSAHTWDNDGPVTSNADGFAGVYSPETEYSGICYVDGHNCAGGWESTGWHKPGMSSCSGPVFDVWIDYRFIFVKCEATPGNFIQTNYQIPASHVCSRIQDKWSNENAPPGVTRTD